MKYPAIKGLVARIMLGEILPYLLNGEYNKTGTIMMWDAIADYFTHE